LIDVRYGRCHVEDLLLRFDVSERLEDADRFYGQRRRFCLRTSGCAD
jgi:hypothetical protein